MLELTQQATDVIRTIVESEPEAPEAAGLRIATGETTDEGTDLDLQFVGGPESGDETVEQDGVRVYLSSDASALLDDKVLDAHEHGDHIHFDIGEQGGELPPHEHLH